MNLLIITRKTYEANISIGEVETKIKSLSLHHYQQHSKTLIGKFNADNSFTLQQTFPWIIVDYGGIAVLSKLKGNAIGALNKTIIRATIMPNRFLLAFFCLIVVVTISELFGLNIFEKSSKVEVLLTLGVFLALLFTLFVFSCNHLQKQFENLFPVIPVN